jgi:hypothetical protein
VAGVQADQRGGGNALGEHQSAASRHGEGALPKEGSVTACGTATVPRPDEPAIGAGDEAPLPTEVRPARPQLKAGARRPSAEYLHGSAIELDVVVHGSGNRSPGEQRRRAHSRAHRRRKQRRGGSRRPRRRDRPAADCGGGIHIPCLVDCAHLEAMRASPQAGVTLRRGAPRKGRGVKLAFESRCLARREREARSESRRSPSRG